MLDDTFLLKYLYFFREINVKKVHLKMSISFKTSTFRSVRKTKETFNNKVLLNIDLY